MAAVELFTAISAGRDLASVQRGVASLGVEVRDDDARTPLMAAAEEGWLDCVNVLVSKGADLKARDAAGRTAALIAAGEGHTGVVECLLKKDKGVLWAVSKSENTALHRAAAYGHPATVTFLLEAGAAMDARNASGETALCRACRWGHVDVVAELLARGADTSLADEGGRTPADWASTKGHTDVTELLQAAAADDAAAGGADAGMNSEGTTLANAEAEGYYYEEGMEGEEYTDYAEWGVPVRVEGWMAKKGHWFRNWKNRWFILDGRIMSYYKSEGARQPQGVINLIDGTDVIIEEKYTKPYCFTVITPTKRFILQAADEDEMAEWIEAIQNNLECCDADTTAVEVADED